MTRSRIRGTRSSIFPPHSLEGPPYSRVIEVHNSASITHKRPIYGRWSCSPATGNVELTFMIRKFVVLTRTCCSTSNSVGAYGWPKFVRIKNGRMASRDLRVGLEAGQHRPRLSVAVGSCLLCVCRLSVSRLTAFTQECHPPLQAPAHTHLACEPRLADLVAFRHQEPIRLPLSSLAQHLGGADVRRAIRTWSRYVDTNHSARPSPLSGRSREQLS